MGTHLRCEPRPNPTQPPPLPFLQGAFAGHRSPQGSRGRADMGDEGTAPCKAPTRAQSPAGGGDAMKAERVCRCVLPGGCTCSPLKEGLLHSCTGGLVVHPMG